MNTKLNNLSIPQVGKSHMDGSLHPEVSDQGNQILHLRSPCMKQSVDFHATQWKITEMHNMNS